MTDCTVETFGCIAIESLGALAIFPSALPTSTGELHQPSPQARTPRVAHCSANSRSLSGTPAGIAPSEWLTR